MPTRSDIIKYSVVVVLVGAALFARGDWSATPQGSVVAGPVTSTSGTADIQSAITAPNTGTAFVGISTPANVATTSGAIINQGGGTIPFAHVGNAPAPSLDYHEALIADLATGAVMFGDQDSSRWPLASVTKLMTAAIATDVLDPTQTITITSAEFAVDPNDTTLSVGDTYTVADLMKIMLLQSSNVAAEALCDFYGHSRFLTAMNARATSLGMEDTYYGDPSGLSSANQSTADDLILLAQNIYTTYPQILAITRTPQATVTNLATNKKLVVKSINDFAGQPGFIGGKTGYTTVSDGNLLSIFKYENRPILIVIMGTDDAARFDNTQTLYNWFKNNFR